MKLKHIIPFFIAALAFTVASCSEDDEKTYLDGLRVSQSTVAIDVNGGSASLTITATNEWEFENQQWISKEKDASGKSYNDTINTPTPKWLTVTPTNGGAGETVVTLTADATLDGRTITLLLKSGNQTQRIDIVQGEITVSVATCKEVIDGPESKTYRVKGSVSSIKESEKYGNWYLKDETGEIYIYGTLYEGKTQQGALLKLGIEEGDIVTVEGPKTVYKGTVELVDVKVIEIEKSLVKVDTLVLFDTNGDTIKTTKLPKEGGKAVATVTCKGNGLGVEIPDEASSWLSIAKTTPNTIIFNVAANSGESRKTDIVFSTTDGKKNYSVNVTIEQEAFVLPHGENPDDPFTVEEAIAKCKEIGTTASEKIYYAKGIIAKINSIDTGSFGNADFDISADGTETNLLKAFRCYNLNNEKFTAADQIGVGDEVVICGKLKNHDSKTPEFDSKCYIYSRKSFTELNAPGSQKNPFTVAEVINFVSSLEVNKNTEEDYYIKGKIIDITDNNQFGTKYGNCTFYISDDGTDKVEKFQIFRTLYLGNVKYSNDSWVKPQAGDEVIICGKLVLYQKDEEDSHKVPETVANQSYIYSLNGQTE
jgi:hypothetical protein